MFMAGAEPVSLTLSLCLYELAVNKEIQRRLRTEINSARDRHGGELNNEFLSDLHYAEMVINGEELGNTTRSIIRYQKLFDDFRVFSSRSPAEIKTKQTVISIVTWRGNKEKIFKIPSPSK